MDLSGVIYAKCSIVETFHTLLIRNVTLYYSCYAIQYINTLKYYFSIVNKRKRDIQKNNKIKKQTSHEEGLYIGERFWQVCQVRSSSLIHSGRKCRLPRHVWSFQKSRSFQRMITSLKMIMRSGTITRWKSGSSLSIESWPMRLHWKQAHIFPPSRRRNHPRNRLVTPSGALQTKVEHSYTPPLMHHGFHLNTHFPSFFPLRKNKTHLLEKFQRSPRKNVSELVWSPFLFEWCTVPPGDRFVTRGKVVPDRYAAHGGRALTRSWRSDLWNARTFGESLANTPKLHDPRIDSPLKTLPWDCILLWLCIWSLNDKPFLKE